MSLFALVTSPRRAHTTTHSAPPAQASTPQHTVHHPHKRPHHACRIHASCQDMACTLTRLEVSRSSCLLCPVLGSAPQIHKKSATPHVAFTPSSTTRDPHTSRLAPRGVCVAPLAVGWVFLPAHDNSGPLLPENASAAARPRRTWDASTSTVSSVIQRYREVRIWSLGGKQQTNSSVGAWTCSQPTPTIRCRQNSRASIESERQAYTRSLSPASTVPAWLHPSGNGQW